MKPIIGRLYDPYIKKIINFRSHISLTLYRNMLGTLPGAYWIFRFPLSYQHEIDTIIGRMLEIHKDTGTMRFISGLGANKLLQRYPITYTNVNLYDDDRADLIVALLQKHNSLPSTPGKHTLILIEDF